MLTRTIALTALLLGAGSLAPASNAPALQDVSRENFPDIHDIHVNEVEIGCLDCHAIAENAAHGQELSYDVRPGHDQCNICHEDEFDEGEFIQLCLTCHLDDSFDLGAFPSGNVSVGGFSHEQHVDPRQRVSAKTGQRLDCVFCHQVKGDSPKAGLPSHPECKVCHAGSGGLAPIISADGDEQCQVCHELSRIDHAIRNKGQESMYGAGMLPEWMLLRAAAPQAGEHEDYRGETWSDVVKFPHGAHVQDRRGEAINCMLCHQGVLTRTGVDHEAEYPSMDECAICHDQTDRVGKENLTENCKVCHTRIDDSTIPGHKGHINRLAHTPSFYLNHRAQARDEDGYCAYCHGLERVSASGNLCAECHAVLKPKNHVAARFSETTHGRLAAMDRENCAVCHQSDFCIRCHNIPPRSHTPLPLFAAGFHRDLAALNLRSCFACHTFEADCLECHEPELRLPR